jgi:two-component system, OmpR family, catabolic regulation response regulator CreB
MAINIKANIKSTNILLLEDDPTIAKTIVYALERAGLSVTHCLLVQDALQQIERQMPDLLILDIGLPDGNGLDVCKKMRASLSHQHIPILMLSAHGEEIDRILGLELGADDYVTKPFSPRELVARVNALLRRSTLAATKAKLIIHTQNALVIEPGSQRATLKGTSLSLTRREFGLLDALLRSPGKIYSREFLLNAVWGADSDSTDRTVDTHIKTLRAKLEQVEPDGTYIETHRGLGYSISQTPASGSA